MPELEPKSNLFRKGTRNGQMAFSGESSSKNAKNRPANPLGIITINFNARVCFYGSLRALYFQVMTFGVTRPIIAPNSLMLWAAIRTLFNAA